MSRDERPLSERFEASWLTVFPLIRVINLSHRTDRLARIERELRQIGVKFPSSRAWRFEAIRAPDAQGFANKAVRGCFLSHLSVLREAYAAGVASVLVLEDDVIFDRKALNQAATFLPLPEDGWDFLYLGCGAKPPESPGLHRTAAGFIGAHAYAVNGRTLPSVIDWLEQTESRPPGHPDGGRIPVDAAYSHLRASRPDLVTLLVSPFVAHQYNSSSDITPGRFDSWKVLRPVIWGLRSIRDAVHGR